MSEKSANSEPENTVFPIIGYLYLNAAVLAFSVILIVVAKIFVGDLTGIVFFALVLPLGFAVVSIFDALYDRLAPPEDSDA